jgi:aspartyl-tRNA(Asn)/glutamyl-tRNA(Gln) amidotransferase subunit A
LEDPWEIVDTIWSAAQAGLHLGDFEQVRERIDPGRIPVIERGRRLAATDLVAANMRANAYYEGWRSFMARYDLVVTPQLPVTAFEAGADHPGTIEGTPTTYLGWTTFTYPFNVTGQPAATIPIGLAPNGLPVCLQIVGRWRDDATVLRAAATYEALAPWAQHRPPVG